MILRDPERDACAGQWPADQFWNSVHITTRIIVNQFEPTAVPDIEAIEQMILRQWLDFATEAGTA
jgi:hypothetical protein